METFSIEKATETSESVHFTPISSMEARRLQRQKSWKRSSSIASAAALADANEDVHNLNNCGSLAGSHLGLSFKETVSTLLLGVPGAAMALFPHTMKTAGFLFAPCILCCVSFVALEAASLLAVDMGKVELANGLAIGTLKNYESYGRLVAGSLGYDIIMVAKVITLCGGCILRISFQTDAICALVPTERQDLVRFMVVMPAFMAFGCVKDLVKFAPVSVVGLIGTGLLYACIMIGGSIAAYHTTLSNSDVAAASDSRRFAAFPDNGLTFQDVAIVSSVCLFNLFGVALVASARPKMANPLQMVPCIRTSLGGLFALYLMLMALGYYGFGQNVSEKIIGDIALYSPLLGRLAALGMIANCAISAPMLFLIVVDTFESRGTSLIHVPLSAPNLLFRFGFIFLLTLLSWRVPHVAEVCGVLASVMSVSLNIFFPVGLHYYLRWSGRAPNDKQSLIRCCFHGFIFIFAVSIGTVGFIGSTNKLMMKLNVNSATDTMVPEANLTST